MNEDFFDRLDKYIKYKGLNDNKVTVQTGIPVGSLGKQRKGSRGLSVQSIAKLLHSYDDLNSEWLLTGKGSMLKSEQNKDVGCGDSKMIRELIELSRQLGEQINENTHLREKNMELQSQIDELKKKEQNKSTQRHSVCSDPNIAAESKERHQ